MDLNGFNRYIVECKGELLNTVARGEVDLIDTLWNVKGLGTIKSMSYMQDLIDTLWNVKLVKSAGAALSDADLIDTLWNVK